MSKEDDDRLTDIAIRIAVLVEMVKLFHVQEFHAMMRKLEREIRIVFAQTKFKSLEGLTKYKLNRFVMSIRHATSKTFTEYIRDLTLSLREFALADLELNRRAYASAKLESEKPLSDKEAIEYLLSIKEDEGDDIIPPLFGFKTITEDDEKIWTTATNIPIAANGIFLLPFLYSFASLSKARIENTIRKGSANNQTFDETLIEIVGTGEAKQGMSSVLDTVENQGEAVINTVTGHIANTVSVAVTSALYDKYIWLSVMDNRTTDICKSRNLNVYYYGKGPVPPAHINCRSTIAPITTNGNDAVDETLRQWAARQPEGIQALIQTPKALHPKRLPSKITDILEK